MPPRTRAVRAAKASKENVNIPAKSTAKNTRKDVKPVRKPLADKTNSASDENASPEPLKKLTKQSNKPSEKVMPVVAEEERPRRNRRLPPRYVENQLLNNLSNSKESATTPIKSVNNTPIKNASKAESPFKTPTNVLDNSIIANRPKRVSRLPSKFDENVSPNKFVPIQCHTSTPMVSKLHDKQKVVTKPGEKLKLATQNTSVSNISPISIEVSPLKQSPRKASLRNATPVKTTPQKDAVSHKPTPKKVATSKTTPLKVSPEKTKGTKKLVQKKINEVINSSNTDLNVIHGRVKRLRKPVKYREDTLSPKVKSLDNSKPTNSENRKILKVNSSFKVLEEKKSKKDDQDIYEFTFDPTEEPPPQKKKRKKVTTSKPAKPKTRVYNNNYEKNIARALADLKNVVTKQKPEDAITSKATKTTPTSNQVEQSTANKVHPTAVQAPSSLVISTVAQIHTDPTQNTSVRSNPTTKNHVSIRVEDIAADFDASIDHDINYSPVVSPNRRDAEPESHPMNTSPERDPIRPDDPLNLRNDLSFFDDQPVANSSMNASSRNPMSTPWRAEFEKLPLKWQANTYVKADMTPALECSFINNFDDSKKKHVYTNMVVQADDELPEIEENEAPKLKQTSIISFIKEVVEKKKKRRAPVTPEKASSLFEDNYGSNKTTNSVATPRKDTSGSSNKNNSTENHMTEENKSLKRKNNHDNNPTPAKIPRKDNENTLFGFDDSENQDQENVSPVKIVNNNRLRSLRSRSGAVLKEINKQTGPMRAELPAAMKAKLAPSSDAVEKMYEQMKSAADAPALLEKQVDRDATNIAEMPEDFDDSQSVHLFEDIELVHHLKPTRKSYGKAKKVTFQNSSDNVSEDEAPAQNRGSDDEEDDLADLSFHLPEVKTKRATKKKKTKKQILSKKEKAEVDAWAACFNSMCEDIEEFDLVVE